MCVCLWVEGWGVGGGGFFGVVVVNTKVGVTDFQVLSCSQKEGGKWMARESWIEEKEKNSTTTHIILHFCSSRFHNHISFHFYKLQTQQLKMYTCI